MQQINLYLDEFKSKKEWLTLLNCILLGIGMMMAMGMWGLQKTKMVQQLQSNLNSQDLEIQSLQTSLETIKLQNKNKSPMPFDEKIAQVRSDIQRRQLMADWFKSQSFGNQIGFSQQLKALGQHIISGIVLTDFGLQQGGQYLWMQGNSTRPKDVPLYISHLQTDPSFLRTKFGQMTILKKELYSQFSLSGLSDKAATVNAQKDAGVVKREIGQF